MKVITIRKGQSYHVGPNRDNGIRIHFGWCMTGPRMFEMRNGEFGKSIPRGCHRAHRVLRALALHVWH